MRKQTDIFAEDFEIPDIVKQKMDDAFATIQMEGNMSKKNISNFKAKRARIFKNQAAVIACICLLALGSITAYTACNYFWSRGMRGTLQSTDAQQQKLVEEGMATIFQATENYADMAVTDGGITVVPEMMVVNEKMVYLSLSVEGFDLQEGEEPCFEFADVYLGENPEAEEGWLNVGAFFYDGTVANEDGIPVYEDGSPLRNYEDGSLVSYYIDEDGKMEYVIVAMVATPENSFLGETLHVNLRNLGTVNKTAYSGSVQGEWNYTFQLSNTSLTEVKQIAKQVEDTVFVLDTIEISPVSIKLNYDVTGEVNMYNDTNGVPKFCGVVLKDGTRFPYMSDEGMSGYTDATLSKAFNISAFDRVIEPEQISALLLETEMGDVEIGLD